MGAVWEHEGSLYDYGSYYDLGADAWIHEVISLNGSGSAWIVIPDATPEDAPFTPRSEHAVFKAAEGSLPLAIIERLVAAARTVGDIK